MLGILFGLVLATSGLNDPGLQNKGLDNRAPGGPAVADIAESPPATGLAADARRIRRD